MNDHHGQEVNVGDYIAYATTSRIWVGGVLAIPEYVGDSRTLVKIQIAAEQEGGGIRKQTFDFVPDKIYRIATFRQRMHEE